MVRKINSKKILEEEEEHEYTYDQGNNQTQKPQTSLAAEITLNGEILQLSPDQINFYLSQLISSKGNGNNELEEGKQLDQVYSQMLANFQSNNPMMQTYAQNLLKLQQETQNNIFKSPIQGNIFSGASSSRNSIEREEKSGEKKINPSNVGFTKSPLIKKSAPKIVEENSEEKISPKENGDKFTLLEQNEVLKPQEVDIGALARTFAKAIGN